MISKPNFDKSVLVCPGAAIVGDVTLGNNVSVWYNAVLRGDEGAIRVGENTNIQDCAVMHEETTVGSGCTIGHGAIVHGCTVGNNVLIGAGTKVLGPVFIGDNARIGAGSVVLRNLPANCTAVGVPAEVVRINNKAVNPADDLDQQDLPDIVSQRLTDLDRRLSQLEKAAQGDIPPTAAQIAARQRK